MKKVLSFVMLTLCLALSCIQAASAEELAHFTFDDNFTDGGNATASVLNGNPRIVNNAEGRNGVLYLDGNDALQITKEDGTPLLTGETQITISYDSFVEPGTSGNWAVFAAPNANTQQYQDERYIGILDNPGGVTAERYYNGRDDGHDEFSANCTNLSAGQWRHVEVCYTLDSIEVYVDNQLVAAANNTESLPAILGNASIFQVGKGNWEDGEYFEGYIDNLRITNTVADPVVMLNPFNSSSSSSANRPNNYDNMTMLDVDNDIPLERLTITPDWNNSNQATITLPSNDMLDDGFEVIPYGTKYAITQSEGSAYRWKLIGWYNIATGNYYNVENDSVTVTVNSQNDNVFYTEWVAESYDFMPKENGVVDTSGTINTADTSSFIEINVFDYTDLVNIGSSIITQNGSASEQWAANNTTGDGYFLFFDSDNYADGSIGDANNKIGDNAYNNRNITDGIAKDEALLHNMFSPNSTATGVQHLGTGNYLFSYDPATGMYSYNSKTNGAIYQQSENRFYVYDAPQEFTGKDGTAAGFFPLNPYDQRIKYNDGSINYWFGTSAKVDFWLPDNSGTDGNKITNADGTKSDMIFTFTGDDDLWVLIDGEVVLDLGGVHGSLTGTINFSTGKVSVDSSNAEVHPTSFDFSAGNHTMEIYYLERGGNESNCQMAFNLLPEWEAEEPGLDVVNVRKNWAETDGITKPISIEVELYNADDPSASVIRRAALTESNGWSHSFAGLDHEDASGKEINYGIKEANSAAFYGVDINKDTVTYDTCWVFTDAHGLTDGQAILIGNGNGQVLSISGESVNVKTMNKEVNIIVELTDNDADAAQLLWTVEHASNQGGRHFYLKASNGEYLSIDGRIHTVKNEEDASLLYLNASGDLQDADSDDRLTATEDGFELSKRVAGNETIESADGVSLYIQRKSETTAYTFDLTNTYRNPAIYIQKTDEAGNLLPGATLQIKEGNDLVAGWTSTSAPFKVPVTQAAYYQNTSWLKLSEGSNEYVYTLVETASPTGYHAKVPSIDFKVTNEDDTVYVYVKENGSWKLQSTYIYNENTKTWELSSGSHLTFVNVCDTGNLAITKTVTGNAADANDEFTFTIQLTNNTHTLASSYSYTIDGADYQLSLSLAPNGGNPAVMQGTITLKGAQTATINALPIGTNYTITETEADGYALISQENSSGSIEKDATKTALFTNACNVVHIIKETDPSSLSVSPTVTVSGSDSSSYSGQLAANSAAYLEVYVKPDVTYTVSETGHDAVPGYTFVSSSLTSSHSNVTVDDTNDTFTITDSGMTDIPVLTLTNTYKQNTGSLTVSKTVEGDTDSAAQFTFTVTLTDANDTPLSGTFGGYTFDENGEGTVTVTAGQPVTISGLPEGTQYTVSETSADGYVQTIPANNAALSGTITKDKISEASFTNRKTAIEIQKVTAFTPAGGSLSGNVTVTFAKEGQSVSAGLVPNADFTKVELVPGAYAITESGHDAPDGYVFTGAELTDANGKILTMGEAALVDGGQYTLTNKYAMGSLSLEKTVSGAETDASFEFTISLTRNDQAIASEHLAYTIVDGSGSTNGTLGEDGKVSLKAGQILTFPSLPIGTEYTITETANNRYPQTTPAGGAPASGTISSSEQVKVSFVNTEADLTPLLAVTKKIQGNAANADDEFGFVVKFWDNNEPVTTPLEYFLSSDEASAGFRTAEYDSASGGYSFTLKANETIQFVRLVQGWTYEIAETNQNGYELVSEVGRTGVIPGNAANAEFTNKKEIFGSLTVSKAVQGNAASTSDAFTFTVTLTDASGAPLPGTFNGVTFDKDGKYTTTLAHNDSFTITGLPYGASYTVLEDSRDYTQIAPTTSAAAAITDRTMHVHEFINEKNLFHDLTVSKQIQGNAADSSDSFSFTVKLTDANDVPLTGKYGNVTFANGEYSASLKGGESFTLTDLPNGTKYTVTEEANQLGYTADKSSHSGSLSENASVSFTNTRNAVRIQKVAAGLADGDTVSPTVSVGNTSDKLPANSDSALTVYVQPGGQYTVLETNAVVDGYALVSTTLTGPNDLSISDLNFTFPSAGMEEIPMLTLTNTYVQKTGGLSITKTVKNNYAGFDSSSDSFEFTVTLKPGRLALAEHYSYTGDKGTSGTLSLSQSGNVYTGTVTVKAGETVTISGLPVGTEYEITETDSGDYIQTSPNGGASGSITENGATAAFTNSLGSLSLSKSVVSQSDSAEFEFEISLTLNGQPLDEKYRKYQLSGSDALLDLPGDNKVKLKHGEKIVFPFLPIGTAYVITETPDNGYEQVSPADSAPASGTVLGAASVEVSFVNTEVSLIPALVVKKQIAGNAASSSDQFSFLVTFWEDAQKRTPITRALRYALSTDPVNTPFHTAAYDAQLGGYPFTLSGGQTATFVSLTQGWAYEVKELDPNSGNYTLTSANPQTGTLPPQAAQAEFLNEKNLIQIKKVVQGLQSGDTVSPSVTIYDSSSTAVWSGTLVPGSDFTQLYLPAGTYTVKEENCSMEDAGYDWTSASLNGVADGTKTSDSASFTFTVSDNQTADVKLTLLNVYALKTNDLVIKKQLADGLTDSTTAFTFVVTLENNAHALSADGYPCTIADANGNSVRTLSVSSGSSISLLAGQTATIAGLPLQTRYSVEERPIPSGYELQESTAAEGTISTVDGVYTAVFTNRKTAIEIKKVTAFTPAGGSLSGNVTVSFTANGGTVNTQLTPNADFVDVQLAPGTYAVAESGHENPDGYMLVSAVLTADGSAAPLNMGAATLEDGKAYVLTNTYAMGSLSLTKQVVDSAPDYPFEFTISLIRNGKPLEDKYLAYVIGSKSGVLDASGKVSLYAGETLTFPNLPIGTTYSITETEDIRYIKISPAGDAVTGQISSLETEEVKFTNSPYFPVLTIEKLITGNAASKNDTFGFLVTLKDGNAAVTKVLQYSTSSSPDVLRSLTYDAAAGGYPLTIRGGETATIIGLTTGWSYTVEETDAGSYAPLHASQQGTLPEKVASTSFTNVKNEVKIQKEVSGLASGMQVSPKVTIRDSSSNVVWSNTLTSGQGMSTITLAAGTYTVTEEGCSMADAGYNWNSATLTSNASLPISSISKTENSASFTFTLDQAQSVVPELTLLNVYSARTGGLSITKTVENNYAGFDSSSDSFEFTITLKPGVLGLGSSYAYSGTAGTNGTLSLSQSGSVYTGTVTVKAGETVTISGLPVGTTYSIAETNAGDYALSGGSYAGAAITTSGQSASFVNALGSLKLSKSVVVEAGGNADADASFVFAIQLTKDGKALDDRYRVYTLNGRENTFSGTTITESLSDSDVLILPFLPIGTDYVITETADTGFEQVSPAESQPASGRITGKDEVNVSFINTAVNLIPAVIVEKTVRGNAANPDDAFDFVIRFWEDAQKNTPVTQDLRYALSTEPASSGFNTISYSSAVNGYPFTLKSGQKATFVSLTEDWTYEVEELLPTDGNPADDYVSSSSNAAGTVPKISQTVSFTNEKNAVRIRKVTQPDGISVAPTVTVSGSGLTQSDSIEANSASDFMTVYVKPGASYTVTEAGHDAVAGYAFASSTLSTQDSLAISNSGGMTFTFPAEGTQTIPTLTLTNVYTSNLKIQKKLADTADSGDTAFPFTVTLTSGAMPLEGAYPYTSSSGSSGTLTLADGKGSLSLKGGETVTITGLPIGASYAVSEGGTAGYVLTDAEQETGVIGRLGEQTAVFTNAQTAIRIRKLVSGLADSAAPPTPYVTIYRATADQQKGDKVSGPHALTPLGDYISIPLVPGTYVIEETVEEIDGYIRTAVLTVDSGSSASANGQTITFEAGASSASFTLTNAYTPVSGLSISKTLTGSDDSDTTPFAFTITLTPGNSALAGSYLYTVGGSEKTLVLTPVPGALDGSVSGVIELSGGQTANIAALPLGTKYAVTEAAAAGYLLMDKANDTGVITAAGSTAAFTNMKDAFSLSISKRLQGNAPDAGDAFTFQVTLTDTNDVPLSSSFSYTKTGDAAIYSIASGGTLTLSGGQTATIANLADGTKFTVTEIGATGESYMVVLSDPANTDETAIANYTGLSGSIRTEDEDVVFINERNAIRIRKIAFGLLGSDTVTPTVTIAGAAIPLTSGAGFTQLYLPAGTYTVTETDYEKENYTWQSANLAGTSGLSISASGETAFSFTLPSGLTSIPELTLSNVYAAHTGALSISKSIEGNAADPADAFTFTLSLTHSGQPLSGKYGYSIEQSGAQIRSGELSLSADGKANLLLTGGQTAIIRDLPLGASYTITEAAGSDYLQTSAEGASGTIARTDAVHTASFVNRKDLFSNLTITKTIASDNPSASDEFEFTITLKDANGNAISGQFECTGLSRSTIAFNRNGQATLKLRHGEAAVIQKLPYGTVYEVTEEEHRNYQLSAQINASGVLDADGETAAFTNAHASTLPSLTISKEIAGNAADENDVFGFTIALTDPNGTPLSGSYHYTRSSASGSENAVLTLDASGRASITLKGGESITLIKLPVGILYTIDETNTGGYTPAVPSISGSIASANTSASAAFVNTKDSVLSIAKTASGLPDGTRYPNPLVRIYEAASPGTVLWEGTLIPGAAPTVMNVHPRSTTYVVEETGHDVSDYAITPMLYVNGVPAADMRFTLEAGVQALSLELRNEYVSQHGSLTLTKSVVSATGMENGTFAFLLHLTDANGMPLPGSYAYSGTLDGTQPISGFVGNGDTLSLMGGGSITINRLPLGTRYTFTESEPGCFKPSALTQTGAIDADGETAAFVNTHISQLPALTIAKKIEGNAADPQDVFTFTVTLTDAQGTPLDGSYQYTGTLDGTQDVSGSVENGGQLTLKAGGSITLLKLPQGAHYTVTEEASDYTLTAFENASGVIEKADTHITASFVNTKNTGAVILKKASGLPAGTSYPAPTVSIYRESDLITPIFTGTLTPNAAATSIGQLESGNYILKETVEPIPGYSMQSVLSVNSQTIAGDPSAGVPFSLKDGVHTLTLTLTNLYTTDSIPLTIVKTSTGLPDDQQYPAPTVSIASTSSPDTVLWSGTLTPNGDAQSLTLPPDTYIVSESMADHPDYSFSSILYVDGQPSSDATFTLTAGTAALALELRNTYASDFGTLTIDKTITGAASSAADAFAFTVSLTDAAGAPLAGSFAYTGTIDGSQAVSGTIENGGSFTLMGGGSITMKLPLETRYTVTETDANGYTLIAVSGASGVITPTGAAASFTNEKQFSVKVLKEWHGDTPAARPSSVRVQLLLNGKPIGSPVTLSEQNNWQHSFEGLTAAGPYTVEEVNVPKGYVSHVTETDEHVFVISNIVMALPDTGDTQPPLELLMLTLISSVSAQLLIRRKKKQANP